MPTRRFRSLLAVVALVVVSCSLARGAEVEIKGNYLEYDEANKFIIATGSVTVSWQNKVLNAREIRFWVEKKYMAAEGNVSITEDKNVVFGDKMTYDYKSGEGTVDKVAGYSDPWLFYARSAQRSGDQNYNVDRVLLTTCDLPNPHYSVRAKRAKVVLGKRLTVYNPVFYLRNVPLFYSPIYTHSLGPRHDSIEIQPGYNNEDGFIVRATYGYPLTRNTYGKLYLDYFSKRGWGKGAEYDYRIGDKMKGTLYGYQIREDTTQNERWTLRGSHWQRINPLWTAQAEAEFLSDTSFNNLYFQENWQRINQRIHSFVAFTRQTSKSNTRIVSERFDSYNPATGGFEAESITLPRIDYTHYPVRSRLFLPIYANFTASVQNQYARANGYYLQTAGFDSNITGDYRITRDLTLKPRLGLKENWQDKTSQFDLTDIFVTRYYWDINARYRFTRWMDWDAGYNYLLRSQKNSLLPDLDATDFGEETNQIYFVNSMYFRRNVVVRNSTGYNLHVNRFEIVDDWRSKFNPLVNELTWTPPKGFYIYLRQENVVYPYSFKSLQADSRWGKSENKYLNFGVFYQSARPDQLDFNTGIGFWPTKKWKIDYTIRASALNNFDQLTSNDQEIKIYRDLHCWEFKLTYRRRQNIDEVYFLLDLKSAARNRQVLYNRNQEKEFYPWR